MQPDDWPAVREIYIEFHKRCGFCVVGTRERIGQLDGVWRDTVLLERRGP